MMRKNILNIALIFILSITTSKTLGQTTIYSENFTNQENKGAIGPANTIDLDGVDWTVDISAANLINDQDWFKVTNGVFETRDIDGNAIWLSRSINITGYSNVSFSLNAEESGTMEALDVFKTEYKIGIGEWTVASTNGDLIDDFDSLTVSETGLSGDNLQIRVTMNNNVGTEFHRLDNILIEGTATSSDPTVTFNTTTSSINETDTDVVFPNGIPITFTNYDANVTITPTVNVVSTANPDDYIIDLSQLTFTANETLYIPLTVKDDADFNDETIVIDFTITTGTATLGTNQHTITILDDDLPNIIINEILADPGSLVDANGDGATNSGDEFVELVNTDTSSHDLTGFTISDSNNVKYTFGATTIPAGSSVVIFGGGTPTGISGITDIAGGLSFNNTSDTVILKNSTGITIATYTYGNEANSDESIGRSDDLTGGFVKHSTISTNPVLASPGRYNTSNTPFSTLTWTGTTNNDWTISSNWSTGSVPTASDDVQIIKTINQPTISSAVTVNSATINSGATLLTKDAISFTGAVTYKRNLPTEDSWYFMSSPVDGETISDLISNHTFVAGSGDGRIGIAPYDNTQAASTNRWVYQTSASTGDLEDGKGYSMQLDEIGNISFTGTIRTDAINTDITLVQGVNNFNLLGNPYTSYINSTTFLTTQSIDLELTFWMWNGSSYDTRTTGTSPNFMIAPTQGFFVEAKTVNTVNFVASNQNHSSTDTFQKSNSRPEIKLKFTDGTDSRTTEIYYINGTTTSFDTGYDGKLFGGVAHPFALYSHLISESKGHNYAIQSLSNSDYENMVIPIGVNVNADKEITFSTESLNFPPEIKVYLEDKFNNTFTRLDEVNSKYTITVTETLKGIGRFYLHTKSSVLSSNNIELENVSVYKTEDSMLRIVGLSKGKINIKLVNMLGKQVLNTSFIMNGVEDISLPKLANGIYIVQLKTETGKLNKKIILE
ncbi:MAG: hypothetical protein ACI8RP_000386 [Urechidicola sp.]|jgi:hypothetical protein